MDVGQCILFGSLHLSLIFEKFLLQYIHCCELDIKSELSLLVQVTNVDIVELGRLDEDV